jgi:tetratricopeptide (TPR) repeat protein
MKNVLTLFAILLFSNVFAQNLDLSKANELQKKKEHKKAIELYTKVLKGKEKVNVYSVYLKRAGCYFALFDYDNAEADAKRALKIKKNDEDYKELSGGSYWLLGGIYSRQNKKQESLMYYKKALDFSSDVRLYSTVAYMENTLGMYDSAVATINYAFKFDGNFAYAYSNRAFAQLKLGKIEEAQADVEKAIELDPTNPYAFKHRAMIYIELKQLDLACADLNKSVELKYSTFGDETDANEVDELIKKHCSSK